MKYIVILIIAVIMVRIDFWLTLVERAAKKVSSVTERQVQVDPVINKPAPDLIPVKQDATLKQSPKETFLALLEDFRANPIAPIRERALVIFKDHPTMFSQKLDPQLEAQVFRWRDLLNNNEPEVVKFLIDLMNILQGENQEMIKKFFSLWMEINMEHFLAAYSRTRDVNCGVAKLFGFPLSEEEKINELYEREASLKEFVAKEKVEPVQKALANNCLLVLQIELSKIAPAPEPEQPAVDPATVNPVPVDQGGVTP